MRILWLLLLSGFVQCAGAEIHSAGLGAAPVQPTKSMNPTVLGIKGSRFTINDAETFLLGASYYGALAAPDDFINSDLGDLQRRGFNWIRVWANWRAFKAEASVVDAEGREISTVMSRLKWLVSDCDQRGMVVDVTLSRGDGANDSPHLQSLEAHTRAVQTVITALQPWRNWYLDLSNERNVRDSRYTSIEDLNLLRTLARQLKPDLLVTASHGGDISQAELRGYLQVARLDFLTPHRPRHARSPAQTGAKSMELLEWMKELGCVAPVHFQEPFRRGYSKWNPKAEDFIRDLQGARSGAAAGWCFHNGDERDVLVKRPRRSFDLREARLFNQLDDSERRTVDLLADGQLR